MTIDMRLRPPLPGWKNTRMFSKSSFDYLAITGFPRPKSAQTGSISDLLSEMDEAGVEIGVVMGRQSPAPFGQLPNSELEGLVTQHPERFFAWAGIDVDGPLESSMEELHRVLAGGLYRGISIEPTLSPQYEHGGDTKLYPIFELCEEKGLPINISMSSPLQVGSQQLLEKIRPQYLAKASKDFPGLAFHIGHAAWPYTMEMVALAIACPNIWVSPDMYLIPEFPGSNDFAKAALTFLPERTLFGSAYPFKPLKETVQAYKSWNFPAHIEENVLHGNARRLMNIHK